MGFMRIAAGFAGLGIAVRMGAEPRRSRMPPIYDPEEVKPMVEELERVGLRPLTTRDEVDEMIKNTGGTLLLVVNSVCGCAAGNARPGAALALQHEKIPDHLATVFAGVDVEAVERARELMPNVPPSSPCIALFEAGKMVGILERRHIERMTAVEVSEALIKSFDTFCSRQGPSVRPEVFEANEHVDRCGSSIPLYQGESA